MMSCVCMKKSVPLAIKKAIQKTNQKIDSVLDGDNLSKLRGRCEVFAEELKAQHHGGPTLYKFYIF